MVLRTEGRSILHELASILNSRHPDFRRRSQDRPDNCTDCQRLRRQTLRCRECGYSGPPAVIGCSCVAVQADDIAFWRRQRANIAEGTDRFGQEAERVDSRLALLEALPRTKRCRATPDDSERGRQVLAGDRQDGCQHGALRCPVCADYGEGGDKKHAYRIIRELRNTLRSVGVLS